MPVELPKSKVNLRQEAKHLRMLLSPDEISNRSKQIGEQLYHTFSFTDQRISCFLSIEHQREVDTHPIIEYFSTDNHLFVPVSNFLNGTMEQVPFRPGEELLLNRFQIPEPSNKQTPIEPMELDVIFIPLLHADLKGNRLGYGGGFYDRYLALCRPEVIKIGLNFFEPIEAIPIDETDIPLDYLITPTKVYEFK